MVARPPIRSPGGRPLPLAVPGGQPGEVVRFVDPLLDEAAAEADVAGHRHGAACPETAGRDVVAGAVWPGAARDPDIVRRVALRARIAVLHGFIIRRDVNRRAAGHRPGGPRRRSYQRGRAWPCLSVELLIAIMMRWMSTQIPKKTPRVMIYSNETTKIPVRKRSAPNIPKNRRRRSETNHVF